MRRLLVFLTCFLGFVLSAAVAQDVTKVEGGPETHKVILDNAHVRVLDVHVPPGQKIAMHSHPANVVYYVTDAKVKVTSPDGKTRVVEIKAGTAAWNGPVTHAVENVGTSEIHLVQTELKNETGGKMSEEKK
jgi:quercetin dioxygenase-like cupin family protein